MDMYTVIFPITVFVLLITVAGVITNHLISQKNNMKLFWYLAFIFTASLCEYISKKTNGASAEFIGIH